MSTERFEVIVVGSGAGGGVVAATLAEAGLRVVVLEAGGHFDQADFDQLEFTAMRNLFYRGGLASSLEITQAQETIWAALRDQDCFGRPLPASRPAAVIPERR